MLSYVDATILGIVEGITEFLPISSTGHLILAGELLSLPAGEFEKSFDIIIQLGAILAVVVLFWRSFLDTSILKRLAVAFLPTALIGLLFYGVVKTYLIGNEAVVLWALALGGLALILFEKFHEGRENALTELRTMPYKTAALIGFFQSIAIIPGVSRSAATIVGGLLLGLSRVAIVEFSFLLAVPTMAAATGLDLVKNAASFSGSELGVLGVGFAVSFVVAFGAIRWLLSFVRTHSFTPFGVYRIVLAAAFYVLVL